MHSRVHGRRSRCGLHVGCVPANGLRGTPAKAREGAAVQLHSDAGRGLDLLGGPGKSSKPTCLETEVAAAVLTLHSHLLCNYEHDE